MSTTSSSPRLSPIMMALRQTTDEVQLGRVLAAVCAEPTVGRQFVQAICKRAEGGYGRPLKKIQAMPPTIDCIGEHVADVRLSRASLKRRARNAGRIDLVFAGPRWKVGVELKLRSKFGVDQIRDYASAMPVVAIVPDASAVSAKGVANWAGAVSWRTLVPDLRDLPVDSRWRAEWLSLLDVIEHDHDFDVRPPGAPREVVEARAVLAGVRDQLGEVFAEAVSRRRQVGGRRLAPTIEAFKPSSEPLWAGCFLGTPDAQPVWIGVRDGLASVPVLGVWCYSEYEPSQSVKRKLERLGYRDTGTNFILNAPERRLAGLKEERVLEVMASALHGLVNTGVLDDDIEHLVSRPQL